MKKVDLAEVRKDLDVFHNRLHTKQYWNSGKGKKFKQAQKKLAKEKQKLRDGNLIQPLITDLLSNRDTQVPPFDQPHLIKTGKGSNSSWQPPKTCIPLENWIQENIKDLNNSAQPKAVKKHNLNTHQRKALRSLAVDKSITIKPADKGGAIVIMDTIDCILEADRQLSD